jgi:hypothetical protein
MNKMQQHTHTDKKDPMMDVSLFVLGPTEPLLHIVTSNLLAGPSMLIAYEAQRIMVRPM